MARRRSGRDTRAWRKSRAPHQESRFWVRDRTGVERFTAVVTDGATTTYATAARRPTRSDLARSRPCFLTSEGKAPGA